MTHWAFNSSLPLSISALLHALPNTDWYLSVPQSSDAKHLVNWPTAGALGILKTTQVSDKLYTLSVTRDTSLLGRVLLCARKMVNMITCLLHATVSTVYACVWLSVNTILFMLLRGRLMQTVIYTHCANTSARAFVTLNLHSDPSREACTTLSLVGEAGHACEIKCACARSLHQQSV